METTVFSDDNAIVVEPAAGEVPLDPRANQQHTDARNHDIISYLRRPQLVSTFAFDPQFTRQNVLQKVRVPDVLLTPMYRAKLDGFTSFRATAVFTLQLNAQPFQAGRLLMYAVPMPTLVAPRGEWLSKHVTMAQALHNVQIDINKHSQVELKVPFVSPFNSYDLINGLYPWADVYIQVYSRLKQTEQVNLQCLLWAHFEDVELGAPTSGAIAKQQSGRIQSNTSQTRVGIPAPKEISANVANAIRDKESTGLIAKIGSGAQNAYSILGKGIPALSPITNALSTFSKAGSSFLGGILGSSGILGSLLGFSKPQLSHSGSTVVVRPAQYLQNADGNDHSHVMSLSVLNAIDEYPSLGGTDMTETSLTYLKKIPQYIENFCYSKSTKYDTILKQWLVTPSTLVPCTTIFAGRANKDAMETRQPTVLNYVSSSFGYWTGSLVYTIRFVKTDFHSGRVEISYHPFVSQLDKTRMDYVYRLIVDLREKSEVSFTVPYISPQPWKVFNSSLDPFVKPIPSWENIGAFATGIVVVRAITPLICASSIISNNIDCIIEMRAGDDYQLQCPTRSQYAPVSLYPTQAAKQQSGQVYAIPGTQETRTSSLEGFLPPSITGMESDIKRQDTQMLCAGEMFDDFRALIKRFYFCQKYNIDKNKVMVLDGTDFVRTPYLFSQLITDSDAELNKWNQFQLSSIPTPLSFVGGMFAFYRGSFRIKVYNPTAGDLMSCQLLFKPDYGYPKTWGQNFALSQVNYLGPEAFEQSTEKKIAEFQIPYYSPTIITVPYPSAEIDTLFNQSQVTACVSCTNYSEDQTYYVAAAAGDDLSFHMFMGVPPVYDVKLMTETVSGVGSAPALFDSTHLDSDPTRYLTAPGIPIAKPWKVIQSFAVFSVKDVLFNYYDEQCLPVESLSNSVFV